MKRTSHPPAGPWSRLLDRLSAEPAQVDPGRRLRWLFAAFVLCVAVVAGRAIWLETRIGPAARRRAAQPITSVVPLSAPRGKIVTSDATVLAEDASVAALTMHYRYLEQPSNEAWLRRLARRRTGRRNRQPPEAEMARIRVELAEMHRSLAELSGVTSSQWDAARRRIQTRVERIRASVNRRHHARAAEQEPEAAEPTTPWDHVRLAWRRLRSTRQRPETITIEVAETSQYHTLLPSLPEQSASIIEAQAERFAGVKIVRRVRRDYPHGDLAAHVVGYLAKPTAAEVEQHGIAPDRLVGRAGIERALSDQLAGRPGEEEHQLDRHGDVLARRLIRPPAAGSDVVLTLDAGLQQMAEQLLDEVVARQADGTNVSGGAVVLLNCTSGDILALAATPRFEPRAMVSGSLEQVEAILNSENKPLFHRALNMALPPGAAIKPFLACALLEAGVVLPHQTFTCRGYVDQPDGIRCPSDREHPEGHGEVDLSRALATGCHVYFAHFASRLQLGQVRDWLTEFGFGRPQGTVLAPQQFGHLPQAARVPQAISRMEKSHLRQLAIGQGPITVTPLQMARAIAALGNGGRLVTPRLVHNGGFPPRSQRISRLGLTTLRALRRGLQAAASDPDGIASKSLQTLQFEVAAMVGNAQAPHGNHAWAAGYAPANEPELAFAVVIQRADDDGAAAGIVAGHLLREARRLGRFGSEPVWAGNRDRADNPRSR